MLTPQRWRIAQPDASLSALLADRFGLSPLLGQVLINRGFHSLELAERFLEPDGWLLPDPGQEFTDLPRALDLLCEAIERRVAIGICGDYDCDGMTSTALLLRAIRNLGGQIDYAIPSRMREGYGINCRIVEEFYEQGIGLILTVDNGISAFEPVRRASELGMQVIVTDHHDLPTRLPPADAILNPKLLPPTSPYAPLAGVGVAYVLARALAERLDRGGALTDTLLELFTLGTVADLAPLAGVNRVWVLKGLKRLPFSANPGIQALLAVSGLADRAHLKPEAIGFALGPRINAVGRLADPQIVIDLLTADDAETALALAHQCESFNRERQNLCNRIEQEAIALVEEARVGGLVLGEERVLLVAHAGWHHGVIGIVASRLKERYGAPVFLCAIEGESVRGSARGIPEFSIFNALQACAPLLEGFGGHPMAGGFSLRAANLAGFRDGLRTFACSHLAAEQIMPLVEVDARACFRELDLDLLAQIDRLQPCGLGNAEPVFWTPNVRVIKQKRMGETGAHLNLTLNDGSAERRAVGWRMGDWLPIPEYVDIAYKIGENNWQGRRKTELEVVGLRAAAAPKLYLPPPPKCTRHPKWHDHREHEALKFIEDFVAQQSAPVLLYGYARPQLEASLTGRVHYDRPLDLPYAHLLLWSLPPSPLHLHWLIGHVRPRSIHLFAQPVPPTHVWTLQRNLKEVYVPHEPLQVLHLAQKWWISPRALLETLVELGYLTSWHSELDATLHGLIGGTLSEQESWYGSSPEELQRYF